MSLRIDESDGTVVVRDTPAGLWVFGSVFVTSGLAVLTIPFLSSAWNGFVLWERAAVVAIGLAHFAGGTWTVRRSVETTTSFDTKSGNASHAVRRPFSRRQHTVQFRLGDMRSVEIETSKDSDGDPMYRLRLWLMESRTMPLQGQPMHNRARVELVAASLRRVLSLGDAQSTDG